MLPEHSEGYIRVLELDAGKEKLPPQFVIHGGIVVGVQTTDGKCPLSREQNFRLNNMTTRAPDRSDSNEVFQGEDSATVCGKWITVSVDIAAKSQIDDVGVKTDVGRMVS